VTILNPGQTFRRWDFSENLRDDLSRRIDQVVVSSQAAQVLKALLVGKRDGLSSQTKEEFQRAGVGHILAISGLHVGLVAGAAYALGCILLSWIPFFLQKAWTRKGAALGALLPVLVYGLLAGMSPSTQRAVTMVVVFMMAIWIEREHDPLNTLAVAALLILIIDPPSLYSASFQLSFTAVAAILFGYVRSKNPPDGPQRKGIYRIGDKLLSLLKVSMAAFIGTLPLIMFYFGQISLVGPLVNLIAVPVLGLVILPLGLLSAFLFPVSAELASLGLQFSGLGVAALLAMIKWIAAFPYAAVQTVTPGFIDITAYYAFISAVWVLSRPHKRAQVLPGPEKKHWIRRTALIVSSVAVAYISVATMVDLYSKHRLQSLRISIIDVKQGSAALVQFPNGQCMLVDGGGFSENKTFDIGRLVIAPLLRQKRIHRVDTLVLTHPQADHLNGLLYIAENFGVKQIWFNGQPAASRGYQRLLNIIEEKHISLPDFDSLERRISVAGVELNILYPPADYLEKSRFERWRDTNNNSLVLHIRLGDVSFLFPGDIHREAERELVALYGKNLKSTMLMAPHHGSRTSSSESFIKSVQPEIVAISSGYGRKSFPHPSVLHRYQAMGCAVYRTDLQGAIEFITDGKSVRIQSHR
jgi:competence protein ComEC